jgi:hypothetical protein
MPPSDPEGPSSLTDPLGTGASTDQWEIRGASAVPSPHSGPRTTSALGAPPTRL